MLFAISIQVQAQLEPGAGKWKTWFISSGKDYKLTTPSSYQAEIAEVIAIQQKADVNTTKQIVFWNAGSPGYRYREMMGKLTFTDTGRYAFLATMLLSTATYDATIAAWETKYAIKRPRPFEASKKIKLFTTAPMSPSYPCEHSVAAGVAVTIFSKFFPALADSVKRMADQQMASRIAAGISFPSDTRAGFELGKRIAEIEIELTKDHIDRTPWDGKMPQGPGYYNAKFTLYPMVPKNKPVVMKSGDELRPPPPPDFAKEMEELRKFKQSFRSISNAFYWANEDWFYAELNKRMFENNLYLNAPRAARIHAIFDVMQYDGFISCFDAKYAYWGIRPNQYDTAFKPILINTPPFPGYPSGHATFSAARAELMTYFFPEGKELFMKKAKDGAESRFQAGIHFRTDNAVGLDMGKKIGEIMIRRAQKDGSDQ